MGVQNVEPFPTTVPTAPPAADSLAVRARSGDVAAFEALYREHVGRIHGLCLWMTRDAALAEELTQEVFIRAWRKLDLFRPDGSFAAWLHRLAMNVVFSAKRSNRRHDRHLTMVEDPPETAVGERPELDLELRRLVARLPDRPRTVFVLHDVLGYRHAEISAMTGMAEGTSKTQLHRARRRLREALR